MFIYDEQNKGKLIRTLRPGSYFGEVSLLKQCPRTSSVKSKNYTTCAAVGKVKFDKLLLRYPYIKASMEDHIRTTYNDKWRHFVIKSLRNIEYLDSYI